MGVLVKSIRYNWRQVGSTADRDGAGEDWDWWQVGEKGVIEIVENPPRNEMQVWNYEVSLEGGRKYRIFNPNFVEYFPSENCLKINA